MATRETPVERFYDPADLVPGAPRLYVRRNGTRWELRDDAGELLSTHATDELAIDAALERSRRSYCEILVRGASGRTEWLIDQDPELLRAVAFLSKRWEARQREAAD